VPRGGPDGGDGGKGGDIFIVADISVNTLLDCKYQQLYRAKNGAHGSGNNRQGRSAESVTITVPVGTLIIEEETGNLIGDLSQPGQTLLVAAGGRGGRGNTRFATARNQAPRRFDGGGPGQEKWLLLELKLMADVGLVGMPNAGKSTLISSVSNARPKIADYPFTTKVPALGLVKTSDGTDFVMADIPGLVKDAHKGAGMGDQFLRHVERTRILLHLIDPAPYLEPSAEERFDMIMEELASYGVNLLNRPLIAVITKIDVPENREAAGDLRQFLDRKGLPIRQISAVTREGLDGLLHDIAKLMKEIPKE
jgi:GTPase